jgi:glycosyltransferase involved in cell wall biosynthesis
MSKHGRVLIAIPVWNEARHIGDLLDDILRRGADKSAIVVVDDGSTDGTRDIVRSRQVHLLSHANNRGKGAGIKTAMRWARDQLYDWVLFLDGDGQHEPAFIPEFVRQIETDRYDVIIGNRQLRSGCMPWHRRLSNLCSSAIVSWLTAPLRIHDSQCGFRAVRLANCNPEWFEENGYQFETELILTLAQKGFRFNELPISTHYNSAVSKIALVGDTFRFFRVVIKRLYKRRL